MLTKRSQGESETEASTEAGQVLMMGEAVAGAFEERGGGLGSAVARRSPATLQKSCSRS
jgi:hypothetical protein